MDLGWIIALAGALIFIAVFLSGYALLMTRPNIEARLRGGSADEARKRIDWLKFLRTSENVLKPLGEMIPRSPEEMSRQEKRLAQAGIRRRDAPLLLYGIKIVVAIITLLILTTVPAMRLNILLTLLVSILIGAMIPDLVITRLIRRRKETLQRALPDALDLAVVCVEAGLGLDQSLVRIGQELRAVYPPLSDELNLYSLEVNAGRKRSEALRNLGQRTDVDDVKSFAAVLIQTDRFGTSVAQALRTFAETMRTTRRQRAEEHAAKMTIKMIPPLVFFIFPVFFIIVLFPAVIAVIRHLMPIISGE